MATGSDLLTDLARLLPEYDNAVSAEQARALGHASVRQKEISAEIRSTDENYFLVSATFATVASRSPNRYSLPDDFGSIRYLERVVDETNGAYDRLVPVQAIPKKDEPTRHPDLWPNVSPDGLGTPERYFLGGDFLQIFPICDAVYTLRIWYDKVLSDVSSGGTIALPSDFYPALLYGTAIEERLYRRDDYSEMERRYETALARALQALEQRSGDGPRTVTFVEHPAEYC